jgi:catechol 2,3-dioxygenase-like lactoylglutathione lyase family enzyme
MPTIFRDSQRRKRRTVHLRWEAEPYSTFIVLSEHPDSPAREPTRLDEIGIHHFSLWVSDLQAICERLQASEIPIFLPPTAVDTAAYGEELGGQILTSVFQDPDGVILQLDERVKEKG